MRAKKKFAKIKYKSIIQPFGDTGNPLFPLASSLTMDQLLILVDFLLCVLFSKLLF